MNSRKRKQDGRKSVELRWSRFWLAAVVAALERQAQANPEGMSVVQGSASAHSTGANLTLQVSQRTFLDWRSFNIRPGETTTFLQPSAQSVVINRINDSNASQIWGSLNANGTVILANPYGFWLGPDSHISVGGFIATTARIDPETFGSGAWQFTGMPPLAKIENHGVVQVRDGGPLFLISERIDNQGTLSAPGGSVGLFAGKDVLVSERPDGRGLSASVNLPTGSIDNSGKILADAGTIALRSRVVNQDGIIQADSVREVNGVIELLSSEELNLGSQSQILARGDASATSAGGQVVLKSEGKFSDTSGGIIAVTGGLHAGNGGHVEISAPEIFSLHSAIEGKAATGSTGGSFLLDPLDIELARTGPDSAPDGNVPVEPPTGTLKLNVDTAFANINVPDITLRAARNITLKANTLWNLSDSTGQKTGNHLLTLQAGNDITFESGASIVDATKWSIKLQAGYDFDSASVKASASDSETRSIFLNGGLNANGTRRAGSGALETFKGNIDLEAAGSIIVGTGFIRTIGGGNISARAVSGDVDAGKNNLGYIYSIEKATQGYGYALNSKSEVGGISTANGGNVKLEAGHDIVSIPTVAAGQTPGGSGAFGTDPGDVTLIAGHLVKGNFLVRHGAGNITVLNPDGDAGESANPLNLSLISGSWNVWAARNIYLNEVRNPNGVFNAQRLSVDISKYKGNVSRDGEGNDVLARPADRVAFRFDYAANAGVDLWAGNGITLQGNNVPRLNSGKVPLIYPPKLTLNAGAGGIEVQNEVILYPSADGLLSITTRDGGDLKGPSQSKGGSGGITMSDSGLPNFDSFARGHSLIPLHRLDALPINESDPVPVKLTIDGGIENFVLRVPTFAEINVAQDTFNFAFHGQHATIGAVSRLTIAGDVRYQGNVNDIYVDPDLYEALPAQLLNPNLSASRDTVLRLSYNPTTRRLAFVGAMTQAQKNFLLSPSLLTFDQFGQVILDATGAPVTTPIGLTDKQKSTILALSLESQKAALGDTGLDITGPGTFVVKARNMDLGASLGISSGLPSPAIAGISPFGAKLDLHITGYLNMTFSRIANEAYKGDITLDVGGKINLGSTETAFSNPQEVKGIYTTSGGNISVRSVQDINVNGSRIAAYTGGNISVESTAGDINAGSGGSAYKQIAYAELDPATQKLNIRGANMAGSGILATTPSGSHADIGNITIKAEHGDVNASGGGIIQLALNGQSSKANFIDVTAGGDIDARGSGIIGSSIKLKSISGSIQGIVVGSGLVDIASEKNVNVIAFGLSGVSISAGGSVGGNITGGGSVSVKGDSISGDIKGKDASITGDKSAANVGIPPSAAPKSETKAAEDASTSTAKDAEKTLEEDEEKKRNPKTIQLARKVGRVTVILPEKQ